MGFGFIDLLIVFGIVAGPTKALAVLMAGTGGMTVPERRGVAVKAVLVSSIVLFVFAFLGQRIIKFFHVTLPALEIAGGLILLIFALGIVLGDGGHDDKEKASGGDIAIYPLAMPLLATPQAIVALVVIMSRYDAFSEKLVAFAALGTQMLINLVVMWFAAGAVKQKKDGEKSGAVGDVILRVVSILLAALAVQLMIFGFRELGVIPPALAAH